MEHNILLAGSRGTCPACFGVMGIIGDGQIFRCVDCGATFRIKDGGRIENELIVEKLEPQKKEVPA